MLDLNGLEPNRPYWAISVVAPEADWRAAPGCRRGARFLIDDAGFRPSRQHAVLFDSRGDCLEWIMRHRRELACGMPGATARPVRLANWLLGLD